MIVNIPSSLGELIDKITILEIKAVKVSERQYFNVQKEF